MKKFVTILPFLILFVFASSQQVIELEENVPVPYNGLEYGYYISNEQSKEVKGEPFERYEIILFVNNKNSCLKLVPFKITSVGNTDESEITLADFTCKNATGKRLTAKTGKVTATPWYTQVKIRNEAAGDKQEKYKTVNAQVGYAIRSGESLSKKIIVIVPKGEKPRFTCQMHYLPDGQM